MVGDVDLRTIKDSAGRSAYDSYQEQAGVGLRESLRVRMLTPAYTSGFDGDAFSQGSRAIMLHEVIQRHRDQALALTKRQYPQLQDDSRTSDHYKAGAKAGRPNAALLEKLKTFSK